jgi:hypothetical protein
MSFLNIAQGKILNDVLTQDLNLNNHYNNLSKNYIQYNDSISAELIKNINSNLSTNQNIKSNDLVNDTLIKNQTTTTINSQNKVEQDTTIMPSVRNIEETFKRMMLYSTHVV